MYSLLNNLPDSSITSSSQFLILKNSDTFEMKFIITFSCLNITVVSQHGQTQTPYCMTPVLPVFPHDFPKFPLTIVGKLIGSCSIKFLLKMTTLSTLLFYTHFTNYLWLIWLMFLFFKCSLVNGSKQKLKKVNGIKRITLI